MRPSVYIETSVVSYLTAWPSRDIVTLAHQQITREWWKNREQFELYTSSIVHEEASCGDKEAARLRIEALKDIPMLVPTPDSEILAKTFISKGKLPEKAEADALHIAIAATYGIDYLLSWNCAHIANVITRRSIENMCRDNGYDATFLCTPEELVE